MLTTINPGALARYHAKKEAEKQSFILHWHESQSHFMEDVLADYWSEFVERQEIVNYSNRAKLALDARLDAKKHKKGTTENDNSCKALSFVRPPVFNRFEIAVLQRASYRERAEHLTRKAREKAVALALAKAEKLQPAEKTDCYKDYKPKMKYLRVFRLHNGKYHLIKKGLIPVRLHINEKRATATGLTYKHLYLDRGKVKNMLHPSFVFFPDDKPIENTSFMCEIMGTWINETALDYVIRTLKTQFAQSGHPFIYLLLMQAQKQKHSKGALDYNCEVQTSCKTSTRYKDALTGRMMQRERPYMTQEIIRDDGKMLDYTGLIPGETKVNLEEAVYQDVQELFGIASLRITELVHIGLIAIPSDLKMQKGSVYSALNNYIKTSKKQWAQETPYIVENGDNEEYFLDAETMQYTDEYKSNLESVLDTIRATVAKHTAKQFKLDKAIQAFSLSMDYENTYIAEFMGCDEKQVRRWIKTVNDALQADKEFKELMYNAI